MASSKSTESRRRIPRHVVTVLHLGAVDLTAWLAPHFQRKSASVACSFRAAHPIATSLRRCRRGTVRLSALRPTAAAANVGHNDFFRAAKATNRRRVARCGASDGLPLPMILESSSPELASYRFENVEVFPVERRLVVGGVVQPIGARAFDVLLALVERRERLVTRDELLDICWPRSNVEPNNLSVQIGSLRRVVGRHVIASVPGRGYRFSAVVQVQSAGTTITAGTAGNRTNLPELTPLVGRADQLSAVLKLIGAQRLVTIVGAGGVGKSRLAQHVLEARRDAYRHGVCWVELGGLGEASSVAGAIAGALGINLGSAASDDALEAALVPFDILIALDNAEHLLSHICRLAESIGRRAPHVRLLITSQVPLGMPHEHLYRLGPLSLPAGRVAAQEALAYGAIELFVQRAMAVDAHFDLSGENVDAVVGLCEKLDGLPLAIQMAAARLPLLSVQQIAASLTQRLRLLTGGYRNAPLRQQTMAAALDWSHQLLGPDERAVFRRMAVVVGSASIELVQAIAADVEHGMAGAEGALDASAVIAALAGLIDRSLITVDVGRDPSQLKRYRLLEIPRAYAAERLAESDESDKIKERHARAVAAMFGQAWADRWSGLMGYRAWIERLDADRLNGRAALLWAESHADVGLILKMAPVLLNRVLPSAGYDERARIAEWLDCKLSMLPPEPGQLPALIALMRFWNERDVQRGLLETDRALLLAQTCGDRFAAYQIRAWRVRVLVQTRKLGDAAAELDEVDAIEDPTWPATRLWLGAEARSCLQQIRGTPEAYIELIKQELAMVRRAGDAAHVPASNLIDAYLNAGRAADAATFGRQLVNELQGTRSEQGLLMARINLGAALLAMTNLAEARPVIEAAWRSARHFTLIGDCADYMALLAALEERWPAAASIAGYADAAYARRGIQRWPNELRAYEHTIELTRTALGHSEFERIKNEGGRLADLEITAIAFPSLESA